MIKIKVFFSFVWAHKYAAFFFLFWSALHLSTILFLSIGLWFLLYLKAVLLRYEITLFIYFESIFFFLGRRGLFFAWLFIPYLTIILTLKKLIKKTGRKFLIDKISKSQFSLRMSGVPFLLVQRDHPYSIIPQYINQHDRPIHNLHLKYTYQFKGDPAQVYDVGTYWTNQLAARIIGGYLKAFDPKALKDLQDVALWKDKPWW